MWESCKICHLRTSYTPAYGATGATRKAGPLKADAEAQMARIPANELAGNRNLKDEKIMMDGAETSLLRKLEKVQELKKKKFEDSENAKEQIEKEKLMMAQASQGYGAKSATPKAAASLETTSTVRKSRKPENTAEDHEAQVISVGDEPEDWTPLP